MIKLLKGGHCFTPDDAGKKDILVISDKIYKIEDDIPGNFAQEMEIIDCSGSYIWPGFIDQHVHITGGGGEEGPISRIPEIMLSEIISAGVTTVVGVLGADDITRSMPNLLAKAHGLQAEGITTFVYTGSYRIPTATLTGRVISDISLVDKAIGAGEIAIADYRSSYPTLQQMIELASEVKTGALIGAKAGVMHIHVGDGKGGMGLLFKLLEECDLEAGMFVPTHINRNKALLEQGIEYLKKGGCIDLTAGEKTGKGYSVPDALKLLLSRGVNMEKITVSSDGNGSVPSADGGSSGIGKVVQLFNDVRSCILDKNIKVDIAIKTVTANVAKVLKLYPKKGALMAGSDADIIILNKNDLSIKGLIIGGGTFIENGKVIRKGRYEV